MEQYSPTNCGNEVSSVSDHPDNEVTFPKQEGSGRGLEMDNSNSSYSDNESDNEPIPVLDILNTFCLKIKEEAMISSQATERLWKVAISLL